MMKSLIILPAICCLSVAYGATQMKGADPAQAIMVKPSQQTFSITLKANATTGFRWFLRSYNRHYFKFVSDAYIAPKAKLIGAPGLAKFTFDVKNAFHKGPFMSPIHFYYAQPWNLSSKHRATYYIISIPGKPAKKAHITAVFPAHKSSTVTKPTQKHHHHHTVSKPVTPIAKNPKTENTSWLSLHNK